MASYPTSPRSDFLAWCESHISIFTENAAAIGLTPAQAVAFKNSVLAAQEAGDAQEVAKNAAKNATAASTMKFNALRKSAGDTVRIIKTFAETTDNPGVYTIAQVPPPQPASSVPPPAKPTEIRVTLDPTTGAPMLTWKAANPVGSAGTSYIIKRRTSTTGEFTFVGVTGSKKFTDNSFFAGPDSVQYTVQGQRSDSAGPVSEILTINFGRVGGGGGNMSISSYSSSESQPMKLAA